MQDPNADHEEGPHFLFNSTLLDVVQSLIKIVFKQREMEEELLSAFAVGNGDNDGAGEAVIHVLTALSDDACNYVSNALEYIVVLS